jgi:DNA-binding FadR family transcriptional regulator
MTRTTPGRERAVTERHKVRPKKAAVLVADQLRAEIVTGEIAVGESLPVERDLIETFGVSRPTLREALRILETEGLLQVTRGVKGGAKVLGPSLTLATHAFGMILQAKGTKLVDVQIARSIIEPPAARMVAERQSPEDQLVLCEALQAEREALGTPELPFAAMRFHEALIGLSRNNTIDAFLQVLHDIHEGAAVMFSRSMKSAQAGLKTVQQHELLLECIERGDGDAAEALWREYWEPYTRDRGREVVDVLAERR